MAPLEQRIRLEQLQLALGNILNSALPPPLAAIMVTLALYNTSNVAALTVWCATTVIFSLAYTHDARRGLATGIRPEQSAAKIRRLILQSALFGCCWGALPWVAFDPHDIVGGVLIFAIVTALAANAMATLAPILPAFIAFILLETAGPVSKLITLHDSGFLVLALGGPLYVASLIGMARNTARSTRAAIMLRFENIELVERLEKEKAYAEQAHREAEQANRAKSQFLAAASHDLRQPIQAQGLFMDVLDRADLPAPQQDLLGRIRDAWQASVEMLDALLDFSRIDAGVVDPQCRAFSLQPLLTKLEQEFGPQADSKGLVYRCRETLLAVESDPLLLELVLRNLIANAIRYTDDGGLLIGCRKRGDNVAIEVWDTGIGMTPEQQREVFQEFYQVGNSERDRRKGLGLGLAISDGLARALNHPLSLGSRAGRGSVFRIVLPLTEKAVVDTGAEPALTQTPVLALRILVIDDDDAVREGMRQLLNSWACDCRTAESLEQALAACENWRPEILISDYRLRAGCTGAETIAQLRERLGQCLPALLLTGDTAPERLREARSSGVPLLHKPVSALQLYRHILAVNRTT